MDEMFWRKMICFSPDTSHCLLSCCVYTLHKQPSVARSSFAAASPHVTSAAFRPFCLEIKARRVGSVGARGPGEALSPTTQVSPDLSATGWLCLQPEQRPRAKFRGAAASSETERFCFVSLEEGPNMESVQLLQLHISARDFLGCSPTLFQWPLTKPAEHRGCNFPLLCNTDDVLFFVFLPCMHVCI